MAVPSTGQVSMLGLFNEQRQNDYSSTASAGVEISQKDLREGDYSTFSALNTLSPSIPPAMPAIQLKHSEWYSYDHTTGNATTEGDILEDWSDNTLGNSTSRTNFSQTSYLHTVGIDQDNGANYLNRPTWTLSPNYANPTPGGIRLHNSTSPQGQWHKITGDDSTISNQGLGSTSAGIDLSASPTLFFLRYRFKMTSSNNKDSVLDIRMNTTNHPNPGVSTSTYQLQVHDNADPATGKLSFKKRSGGTTITTLGASATGAYTLGTTVDVVVGRCIGVPKQTDNTWKVCLGPATTPSHNMFSNPSNIKLTAVDNTFTTFYGMTLRVGKFMSTPTTTHYHEYTMVYVNRPTP